jgi:hypothetical protein
MYAETVVRLARKREMVVVRRILLEGVWNVGFEMLRILGENILARLKGNLERRFK